MNLCRTILTTTTMTLLSTAAFAQQCENGVCRLRPAGTADVNPYTSDLNRGNYGRLLPPNTVTNMRPAYQGRNSGTYSDGMLRNSDPRLSTQPHPSAVRAPLLRSQDYEPASYTTTISWETDFRRATQIAQQTGRPLLIQVGAEWCGFCQRMKRETFANQRIISDISNAFVAVHIDAGANRELVKQLRVQSLPTVLVMSPDLYIVDRQEGFRSAQQLSQTLNQYTKRALLDTEIRVACQ